ncbi:uncharacterized protein EDB91DRAFT_1146674 [Suillus paluster]|uniref:uncharacterized protein n=1 Tax=Suillus paluster TaxID=48578 RepID=UPI001B85DC61|nr:uncharacterized protein EDB91DRAFT_1146674 [Suillus paluster]KAG1734749.1 hypothetical protein EDB91DRAFT_1146674 [Suillus paluster]
MLENFTKTIDNLLMGSDEEDELLDRQTVQIESSIHHVRPDIKSHWASAIADTIQVPGCSCIWCRRNSDSDGEVERGQPSRPSHPRIRPHKTPMATTSEVMEVLYPPSYLNTPSALDPEASPPAYELRPTVPPNTPQVQPPLALSLSGKGLIPSAPYPHCTCEGFPIFTAKQMPSYDLFDIDTLLDVAVPSAQSPTSRSSRRTRRSQPIIGLGLESPDAAEPPAYSSSHPQFPAASDSLGPYPHISLLSPNL